jgi:Acyl-CoA reductase (LuxC)
MAVATASRETSIVEIPLLVRGRVIEPGEDSVEFGGRVGARFRTPDPRRYASQLVLADAGELRDLQSLPVDEIIDFLVELGQRLVYERNPLMQEALELALDAGELTEPIIRPMFETLPEWFERGFLEQLIETIIGKGYVDGWVDHPVLAGTRVRAVGTRTVHIIAGNVPHMAAISVIHSALCKCDSLIKVPSNDPFTAMAIVRTMFELDSSHPVSRHVSVAYWKGGDTEVEREVYRPSRIEKLIAWGGSASMRHIQQYLVPGIELIANNPKVSIAIVGREALRGDEAMREAAVGVAVMAGRLNQSGCTNARVVYVECDTDEKDLDALERLGREIHAAFELLPQEESTAPKVPAPDLAEEMDALSLDQDFYRVIGDSNSAGVVVSRTEDPVEFADRLRNRVVNLVPVAEIAKVTRWLSEATQTVGIYPPRLHEELRDPLALAGVQHIRALTTSPDGGYGSGRGTLLLPHDGMEPMRRMVRWTIDQD